MKRDACLMLAVIIAAAMTFTIPVEQVSAAGGTKVKTLKYSMKPDIGSMTVKWKKKKVSYYLIYRTEFKAKTVYDIGPVPLSKYKKVKKVSGKKTSWKDKKSRTATSIIM